MKPKFKSLFAFLVVPFFVFYLSCSTLANHFKPSTINSEFLHKKKEWKISAYLDGDCGSDIPAFWSFNKLEKVGSNETIDIYAQLDRWESDDGEFVSESLCKDSKFGTKRYYVLKDDDMLKIKSKEIPGFGKELNMGLYKNFEEFVEWIEKHESKHHMAIIKGHGYGMLIPLDQIQMLKYKSKEYNQEDDQKDNALSTYTIDKAFDKELKNDLELIVFDSCQKATIEVAYQLKDHAKVMIASEDIMNYYTEFGNKVKVHLSGLEYDKVLEYITKNPNVDTKKLGKFIIDSYFELFQDNPYLTKSYATLSAIDLENIDDFVEEFSEFSGSLITRLEDEKTRDETINTLKNSLKETQNYDLDSLFPYTHVDLFDFLKNLYKYSDDTNLKGSIEECLNKQDIIIKSECRGEMVKGSKGISILFTESFNNSDDLEKYRKYITKYVNEYYNKSCFAKKTEWGKVIELYQQYSIQKGNKLK